MQKKDCVLLKCCRLCGNKDIIRVFNLGYTPLANSYSNKNVSSKLKKYPLGLNLCNGCGHLQLSHSVKPEKMFSNYLYKTNTSYKNFLHFKNYANKIKKKFSRKGDKILDIASNDGTFLNFFNKKKFFRVGIDPAKNLKKLTTNKGIIQIDDFFTEKTSFKIKKKYQKFDIITANHVCAHVENLNDFFRGVKNLLKDDGIFIFEVSYRGSVLKKNTFDTIYHEHLDYHALSPISKFIKKFNLKLFDFEITEAQGGSLRVYVSKNLRIRNKKKIKNQLIKEKKIYKLFNINTYKIFREKINNCKVQLQRILKDFDKKNYNIAGYGAAAKTTTLLNYFNLNKNKTIKFIFDDNKLKQGLYLPGTQIKILDPRYLFQENLDILIIFAWNYSDIIIKNIKKKLKKKKSLKFLVPFPKPKILK
ncbi:methyltransferase domain-containing protein [Pelagibacterales bacterium SAG-MED11]|nr:methyltransferase domain-containing protein [Pelagibacterales bacterium SAG-MED11]